MKLRVITEVILLWSCRVSARMAPAVAKILKNGHGIHLPASPSSAPLDSDVGLASQMIGGCDLQEVFRNLPSAPFPLCIPTELVLSHGTALPHHHHHHHHRHAFRLGLVPPGRKSQGGSQRVAPVIFPGGADMFKIPAGSLQEARPLNGGRGPDGGDVTGSPPALPLLPLPPLPSRHGVLRRPTPERDAAAAECLSPPSPPRPFGTRPSAARQEAARTRLRRQAALQDRAHRLRGRLQALLGQHASQHCEQQLEGLRRRRRPGGSPSDALPQHVDLDSGLGSTADRRRPFKELAEFGRSSRTVLRGLQEVLDSEATASSSGGSSDEEQAAVERMNGKTEAAQLRERRWLAERAALGSRWSWLQLRLAELDGRIQQAAELHRHVRSNKVRRTGRVVLAESQPLTDTQIQRTLLREMAGLSCTTLDADSEPCSPTRLLHNIERQSAQLNQIVNSLMSPLGFSPPSKQANACAADKVAFTRADEVFVPGCLKRKRAAKGKITKSERGSLACARTRPLVSHCRRRLFAFSTRSLGGQQDSGVYVSSYCSSCPCSSSRHPVCADPGCSFRGTRSCGFFGSYSPPSQDSASSQYLRRKAAREEWRLGPPLVSAELFSPAALITHSSTPLHTGRKLCKQRARHRNSRVLGLSPIRTPGFTSRGRSGRANQRKRKRRRQCRLTEDEEDFLSQLCDTDDGSDEVLEHKQATQGLVRKCPGESVYNINNVVIPSSGAKVEKLQYKDIVTPRWRVVDTSLLTHNHSEGAVKEEEPEEDASDEAFARRHSVSERGEKMHRMSWGKRPCCRHPKRSGSRWSGGGGGTCTSGEESAVELSRAQADADELQSLDEWLAEAPWKQREFPLTEEYEDALFSDDPQKVLPGRFGFGSVASLKLNLPQAPSAGATLPSGGQSSRRPPESGREGSASV
ncbi:KAT8 regulatory NSL complex subunit 1-like protein isoform X2 [Nelusetta ayraudi]|uniref:KAT8 regulatory NSL complex subunit 1-like protein isoform X2 n=1 Tax=Nelusetta ayraudi TaxID=303726 RepID=UPI003F70A44E